MDTFSCQFDPVVKIALQNNRPVSKNKVVTEQQQIMKQKLVQ